MNAGEKAAAYYAKFNHKKITTMAKAMKVMTQGKDHEDRDEAMRFLHDAISYYTKTDVWNEGVTLEDWILNGDWTGEISTAKQLAIDYDAR